MITFGIGTSGSTETSAPFKTRGEPGKVVIGVWPKLTICAVDMHSASDHVLHTALLCPEGRSSFSFAPAVMYKVAWIIQIVGKGAVIDSELFHERGEFEAPIPEIARIAASVGALPIGSLDAVVPSVEEFRELLGLLVAAGVERVAKRTIWPGIHQRPGFLLAGQPQREKAIENGVAPTVAELLCGATGLVVTDIEQDRERHDPKRENIGVEIVKILGGIAGVLLIFRQRVNYARIGRAQRRDGFAA